MASLGMGGPFDFDSKTIDKVVTKTFPGNYALGWINSEGAFIVKYVGRSDSDVRQELKFRLSKTKYKKFKCSYALSIKDAFQKECQNYHDFNPEKLDNEIHPAKPENTNWTCPVCGA